MEASGTTQESIERGTVGRQTYDRVRELLGQSDGMTTRQAFERVSEETGRSVGTVQTAYYRVARSDPNSTVKRRPRSGKSKSSASASASRGRGRRAAPASGEGSRLIENFLDAQQALLDYVKQLESERRQLETIRGALGQR